MKPLSVQSTRVVSLCFFLLLPGFFVYHFLVAKQLFPGLLGGYSSAMAGLLLLPLGIVYGKHLLSDRDNWRFMDVAFHAFTLYYALVLLAHLVFSSHSSTATEQLGIVPQFLALYWLARLAPLGHPRFQRWLLAFLLLMSGAIAFNADEGTFVAAALDLLQTTDYLANYQAYAFVYSVVMLFVLAPMQQRWHRLLVYSICIPALFLNGARTEFIGVVLLILLLEFLVSKHKLATLLVAGALLGIGIAALPWLADLYPESRTVFLFIDYNDDISANERARMLSSGWQSIVESPWIGAFGSYARGEHIHNALSAWVDIGLAGFVFYVTLIAVPVLDLFVLRRLNLRNANYRLAFSLVFLTALFAITAKHFTHQLLPLAVGLYARVSPKASAAAVRRSNYGRRLASHVPP